MVRSHPQNERSRNKRRSLINKRGPYFSHAFVSFFDRSKLQKKNISLLNTRICTLELYAFYRQSIPLTTRLLKFIYYIKVSNIHILEIGEILNDMGGMCVIKYTRQGPYK